jgi:hypothetical protein
VDTHLCAELLAGSRSGRGQSQLVLTAYMVYREEISVVAFVELFVVGQPVSGLADDKAVSSCLDDFDRDNLRVVDAQDPLNLSQEPCEESQVAAGHSH